MNQQNKPENKGRRAALRALTLGSGVVVASHWSKPVINAVMLPAHAQATSLDITAAGADTQSTGSFSVIIIP